MEELQDAPLRQKTLRDFRESTTSKTPVQHFNRPIDEDLFKYFFDLQTRKEKEGPMDYFAYAGDIWKDLIGKRQKDDPENFRDFTYNLINNLHDIDMNPLVYPVWYEVFKSMTYDSPNKVRNLILWSKGDVSTTGYQVEKIEGSVVPENLETLMGKRFTYMVDDEKYSRLADYIEQVAKGETESKIKVVIIEDSKSTFDKVKKLIGNLGDQIEIIPIWAIYSREGQQARQKAEESGSMEDFEREKKELNAIKSPKDLLDNKRFSHLLRDSHIFLDFDGVVTDNVRMRQLQAQAIYDALFTSAMRSTGLNLEEVEKRVGKNLAKTKL